MSDEPTPAPAPPRRRAADRGEEALISDRLSRLERLEEAEHGVQQELVAGVRELVAQGKRREDREVEALRIEAERRDRSAEAEARRVDAEAEERRAAITERATMRAWLRSAVGDKVVPLLIGAAATAVPAVMAWWFGGSP